MSNGTPKSSLVVSARPPIRSIASSTSGLPSSHSVSPVVVSRSPTAAAMSPAYTSSISVSLFACISFKRPIRARLPLVAL